MRFTSLCRTNDCPFGSRTMTRPGSVMMVRPPSVRCWRWPRKSSIRPRCEVASLTATAGWRSARVLRAMELRSALLSERPACRRACRAAGRAVRCECRWRREGYQVRRVPHSVLHWARHSVQAACRSATGVRRAAFESHSGARQEVQAAWAQRWAGLQCLVQVRAAASHRERRAWAAVRSVYEALRHAVRVQVQEQPSALAAERAVADAGPRRDAAVRDAEVHRREAPVARARQAAELAAQDRAVKEQHGEAQVAARDGRQAPVVRRADEE